MRILIVLGEGGHTKEMLTLADMLFEQATDPARAGEPQEADVTIEYGYVIVRDDVVSESKLHRPGPVYRVLRPRDKEHRFLNDVLKTMRSACDSLLALAHFHPVAVITSGPSVAVPACIIARLMRIKVIFVETGSRVTALSTTGRIMYHIAHLFFVQWPELQEHYTRAIYVGRLF